MNLPTPMAAAESPDALAELNQWLAGRSAEERVEWALRTLPGTHALSSSFGTQAAVSLHLAAQQRPDIPVIVIDTGYLFPETYRFIDELTERLKLNLKVYRPQIGIAWMEARMGRIWEEGVDGITRYNRLRKVEPMQRALKELGVGTWIAGLRRSQASTRANIDFLERKDGRWKLHPIADWSDRDVGHYLARHDLPYHPLWEKGYVSIGDIHTTRPLTAGMDIEDTRFFGLKRECGLHFDAETVPST
ncbi:phosphoadenylyl-sulfate reductase [Luteimonas marina]|uniref:Phosphoadenosine 5'-phosphosulfate reductase n=1 Tax=Luteimonas marina TaxID=488485 RepID=A0A5C5TWS5_9GAMM|nr:phosphoadenylyl-sulfate reductase [Luteimonas marina]TWT18611.1 phosphoadenylyl-sulfate reductase [Luteimonas marina]